MENSVVLIDYMGGNNLHAVNAWASTFLELGIELPDDSSVTPFYLKTGKRIF